MITATAVKGAGVRAALADWLSLLACRALFALPDLHRLRPWWRALSTLRIAALRRRPGITVGQRVQIHEGFRFPRGLRIQVGDGAVIKDRVQLGFDEPEFAGGRFVLGARSLVLSDCHIDCSADVRIGDGCHVGRNCQIFTHDHDTKRRDVPILEGPVSTAGVDVGDDVMLYSDVVLLPGTHIGTGAVIAVRSVVTKDVAPYQIVAGVPARPIAQRE